ncbi:capping protein inhibiting regulator of actin dynamics [Aricia agestis]|uniref:capping protein inhibiting regulator of actin dynamics n=1 Tax=Aricia agestis TaxID=91739 RepID=UPI001C202986|nr:capping protein inhibiting regulator of actin dynamics [Aricia agestis]
MVFCYKLITESPRRSLCTSPRKLSPVGRCALGPNSCYQSEDLLDQIPERDWRLLAALARKREESDERERLAEQFHRMWIQEKMEKEAVGAEMTAQYRRYLHEKRQQERNYQEHRSRERAAKLNARRGDLINSIRHKEMRTADMLADREDEKICKTLDKVILEETRAQIAAERRSRIGAAEELRKQLQLVDGIKRANDAGRKRSARLKEASQRLAINRALSTWETMLVRQDVEVEDALRRAHAAAKCYVAEARSVKLQRSRAARTKRARQLANITAHMREMVKRGMRF